MKELMVHIERAVRPLYVSHVRKRQIRQELLGHLRGIYDEELERLRDHDSAVRAAIDRFGPSEDLSRNLKASIPWYSVILSYLPKDATSSVWRMTYVTWVIAFVALPFVWTISLLMFTPQELVKLLPAMVYSTLLTPVSVGLTGGIVGSMHGVLGQPKSYFRALACGVGLCFSILALGLSFQHLITEEFRSGKIVVLAVSSVMLPVIITVMSVCLGSRIREEANGIRESRQWDQLEL